MLKTEQGIISGTNIPEIDLSQIKISHIDISQINLSQIDISQIDINDDTYKISSDIDVTALSCSIKEIGLLNPPVIKKDKNAYIIVSGFRRIKAMILNKTEKIMARIITENLSWSESAPDPEFDSKPCSASASRVDSESGSAPGGAAETSEPGVISEVAGTAVISGTAGVAETLGTSGISGAAEAPGTAADTDYNGLFYSYKAALIAVTENAFQRPLEIMEQVRAVVLLSKFMSQRKIAACSMSVFNSKMNTSLVKKFFALGMMPKEIHALIETGDLAMTAALKLIEYDNDARTTLNTLDSDTNARARFNTPASDTNASPGIPASKFTDYSNYDADTMKAFISVFNAVKLGLNKQMEIITNIHEIAIREDISPVDLIKSDDIAKIINDESIDRSRRGNLLRSFLVKRRYPHLKTAEENFKKNLKQLRLANELRLDAPVNFEALDYTFSFKFKNYDELEQKIKKLSTVSHSPVLRQMIP